MNQDLLSMESAIHRFPILLIGSLVLGSSLAAQIRLPYPPGSGSGGVYPGSGGAGTRIFLSADLRALAGSYQPKDVLLRTRPVPKVEDEQFLWGRCLNLSPGLARLRVEETHAFARPGRLQLVFGAGQEVSLPSLDGVVFHEGPGWVWSAPPGAPMVDSEDEFETFGLSVDLPCDEPPTTIKMPFRLGQDGCLRVQLPGNGTCQGDQLSVTLDFTTSAGMGVIHVPPTTPLAAQSWGTAAFYLTFQLAPMLSPFGCTVTYEPSTRTIVVCPQAGTNITGVGHLSGVTIELDPAEHSLFVGGNGDKDDFVFEFFDPSDQAAPEFFYDLWIQGNFADNHGGLLPPMTYDEEACDRNFWDSVPGDNTQGDLGDGLDGPIRSAILEIHIKGHGCNTETDGLSLGWSGDPGDVNLQWGTSLIELADLAFQWAPGDDAVLCLDLGALPNPDGSLSSLLDTLATRGTLDFFLADDTALDYVELKVLRCNP